VRLNVRFFKRGIVITTVNATEARANLYKLIDDASVSYEPVVIIGKRGNAVLLAEDVWNAISETFYLISLPGMRESIIEGVQENLEKTSTELKW
jgi:antitoxin YefM